MANKQPLPSYCKTSPGLGVAVGVTLGLLTGPVWSAPGSIANSPLFLGTAVQSNILFLVDDSGSMDWEVLPSNNGTAEAAACNPNNDSSCRYLNYTPNNTTERLELCAGYNVMAYDPTITYVPWQGVDSASAPYADQSYLAARVNPYNPATTASLNNHFYFIWNDANGDGVYQVGECPTPAVTTHTDCLAAPAGQCRRVRDLSTTERTNYANWFSYYRKREYVAKRALTQLVANSTARVGLTTLHNHNNVRTQVQDIDDITLPVNMTARANKTALLNNISRIDSNNGTPLRSALNNAGQYFESGNGWGPSPILPAANGGTCQQNFTVMMSDGYWNNDETATLPGDTDSDNNTAWDGGSYADGVTRTLADIAMHYYERDLRPTYTDAVRPANPGVNPDANPAQHMVTFAVAFGVNGTLTADPVSTTAPFAWPAPPNAGNDSRTIDDMRHAAWNGRGQFMNASSPQELIDSLGRAISDIDARSGTSAAVSFNSTSLQTNSLVFQAKFDSTQWSGNLEAFPIAADGSIASNPAWRVAGDTVLAASGLDQRNYTLRSFYTHNGTAGVTLDWANLTTAQKDDLKRNPGGSVANDATGMARLGYIKGDRTCEQGQPASVTCTTYNDGTNTFNSKIFRNRASRLADIVHSSPVFVGKPNTPYPDNIEATPYSTFVNGAAASRRKMVYVGSNGGMLHAFDADNNGTELFAYVPSTLFSTAANRGLHYLTDPAYSHTWYVDLSATAADVYVGGNWKTYLVGGLRGGGKGVFALDVTNPSSFGTADVRWEFTHSDLGYTFSDIRVAKMNNGKWAAIFGNGYNNDPSGNGRAKLFILYLDGSNLSTPKIIDTGAGSMVNSNCADLASDCNGLSSPAIADLNGDGTVDRIYAGDLHGNLWAFDVSSNNPASWDKAYTAPLMKACTSGTCTLGNRQPITARPALARHKTMRVNSTQPNLMVYFGTGQYLANSDQTSTLQQTMYGVWDGGANDLDRTALTPQTISLATVGSIPVRILSDNDVNYPTSKGWYIDLPTSKERMVTNPIALGDLVFFNTMIPSEEVCGYGGSGWLMAVDQLNGGMPNFGAIDIDGNGVIDQQDMVDIASNLFASGTQSGYIPTESRFISDKRITADSSGAINVDTIQTQLRNLPARTSWTHLDY